MRATEQLIAENGIENVSIREIVTAAGQKNESALQYHFGGFAGLLSALHTERAEQIRAKRSELIAELLQQNADPDLRAVCTLMVAPVFLLAQSSAPFRRYIKAFGYAPAVADTSAVAIVDALGAGGTSGRRIAQLLRERLPHLDESSYPRRMEAAVRLSASSMHQQSQHKQAFRGRQAEVFFHHLVDALVGLLSAPVSAQTREAETG